MYMQACLMGLVNSCVGRGKDYIIRECSKAEESCSKLSSLEAGTCKLGWNTKGSVKAPVKQMLPESISPLKIISNTAEKDGKTT